MGIYVQLRRCCPAAKSSSMVDQSNILVFVGLFLRALDVQGTLCLTCPYCILTSHVVSLVCVSKVVDSLQLFVAAQLCGTGRLK